MLWCERWDFERSVYPSWVVYYAQHIVRFRHAIFSIANRARARRVLGCCVAKQQCAARDIAKSCFIKTRVSGEEIDERACPVEWHIYLKKFRSWMLIGQYSLHEIKSSQWLNSIWHIDYFYYAVHIKGYYYLLF